MTGAAHLCALGALRSGAGTVRLGSPGAGHAPVPLEVVGRAIPEQGWDAAVLDELERVKALVVGPGLGRTDANSAAVKALIAAAPVPVVVDADALFALGDAASAADVIRRRHAPAILTPHEGEFARLTGSRPTGDRIDAARRLAESTSAVVLLKGSTTVVAHPDGRARLAAAGDARLATAGTGDVLSGVVGAFLAQGLDPLDAAAAAAYVHGAAAHLGPRRGFVAGDLLPNLAGVLTELW
jgi:NAD(P)H-hydrate epimerase